MKVAQGEADAEWDLDVLLYFAAPNEDGMTGDLPYWMPQPEREKSCGSVPGTCNEKVEMKHRLPSRPAPGSADVPVQVHECVVTQRQRL